MKKRVNITLIIVAIVILIVAAFFLLKPSNKVLLGDAKLTKFAKFSQGDYAPGLFTSNRKLADKIDLVACPDLMTKQFQHLPHFIGKCFYLKQGSKYLDMNDKGFRWTDKPVNVKIVLQNIVYPNLIGYNALRIWEIQGNYANVNLMSGSLSDKFFMYGEIQEPIIDFINQVSWHIVKA